MDEIVIVKLDASLADVMCKVKADSVKDLVDLNFEMIDVASPFFLQLQRNPEKPEELQTSISPISVWGVPNSRVRLQRNSILTAWVPEDEDLRNEYKKLIGDPVIAQQSRKIIHN